MTAADRFSRGMSLYGRGRRPWAVLPPSLRPVERVAS